MTATKLVLNLNPKGDKAGQNNSLYKVDKLASNQQQAGGSLFSFQVRKKILKMLFQN